MSSQSTGLFARRLAQHLCLHCGDSLEGNEKRQLCEVCRQVQSRRDAAVYQRRILEKRCAKCSGPLPAGHGRANCPACLKKVRERAWRYRHGRLPPRKRLRAFSFKESQRWIELEASQARCSCGLLLPCESCIPSIYELAGSRRGPGRVMPEGGPSGMRIGSKR